jgi:hypothetical protein
MQFVVMPRYMYVCVNAYARIDVNLAILGLSGSSWSMDSVALRLSFACFPTPPIISTSALIGSRWTAFAPLLLLRKGNVSIPFVASSNSSIDNSSTVITLNGGFSLVAFDFYFGNFTLALPIGGPVLVAGTTYRIELSGLRNSFSIQSAPPVSVQTFNVSGWPTCGLVQQRGNSTCYGNATLAEQAQGSAGPFALSLFSVAAAGQSAVAPLAGANVITVTLQPVVDLDDSFKFVISKMYGLRTGLIANPVTPLPCIYFMIVQSKFLSFAVCPDLDYKTTYTFIVCSVAGIFIKRAMGGSGGARGANSATARNTRDRFVGFHRTGHNFLHQSWASIACGCTFAWICIYLLGSYGWNNTGSPRHRSWSCSGNLFGSAASFSHSIT